jgi:hypothetical protein
MIPSGRNSNVLLLVDRFLDATLGLRHRAFNHADDDGQYGTAHATTHQLAYDNFPIDSGRCRPKRGNECSENLPATDTPESPSNGVAGSAQVSLLHAGSSSISSDGASDELDDEIDNGTGHLSPLSSNSLLRS